ncbi:MAG: GNAT family N-acetyltransferase [Flavipsychrobacter sp.]
MDPIIRNAMKEDADADAIAKLSAQLGYTIDSRQTNDLLTLLLRSEENTVLVATNDDNVIAWAQVSYIVRVESGCFCELVGLVVDEHFRGNGIGEKLLEEATLWSIAKGCKKLRVRSNNIRRSAAAFYKKMGFSITKTQNVFDKNI